MSPLDTGMDYRLLQIIVMGCVIAAIIWLIKSKY
tara:strand:+ start:399 stop:500 length:102 start_codon:yes stop_codon:yes gene_type:complete